MRIAFISFFFIFFGSEVFANFTNRIQEIKEKRQINTNHFQSLIHELQNCVESSKDISLRISSSLNSYQKQEQEMQNHCDSQKIINTETYALCLTTGRSLISNLRNLIFYLSSFKDCRRIQSQKMAQDLDVFLEHLEKNHSDLVNKYKKYLTNENKLFRRESKKASYPSDVIPMCKMTVLFYIEEVHKKNLLVFLDSDIGDMYAFEKNLTALKILKDKISLMAEVCEADVAEEVEKSKQIVQKAISQKHPFDKMAKKICGHLDQTKEENRELCSNPLNNNSWKYSVSRAFSNQYGSENEDK